MKLYDFDGMFDKKLSDYISKNADKYKEEEWEDLIPELYKKFGDTFIKSVGNTPNGFYAEMTDEQLVSALKTHLKQDVPVSEYLCSAIEGRDISRLLMPLLDGTDEEKRYAVNLLGADDEAVKKYMKMLVETDDDEFKGHLTEYIVQKADLVRDEAIDNYSKGIEKEYMLEIMSKSVVPDDRIFDILLNEFRTDPDNLPLHTSYLASYGDSRALEYLLDKIDEEGISFVEYKELLLAIEALGGTYEKQRDFSSDPDFQLLQSHQPSFLDLFSNFKDDN